MRVESEDVVLEGVVQKEEVVLTGHGWKYTTSLSTL
jgi:hypothetical protein